MKLNHWPIVLEFRSPGPAMVIQYSQFQLAMATKARGCIWGTDQSALSFYPEIPICTH